MLLLLLGGDTSLNPGPLTLCVLNARSVRNKGPLLADIVASNDLGFPCLMETHICPFDSNSFLRSITPPGFIFPHKPHHSGIGGGVGFFIRSSYKPHIIKSPFYPSFENMVVSIVLHGDSLLFPCIYCPPGSCTCNFLEEFMSFVGYLSSINPSDYYIHGFTITPSKYVKHSVFQTWTQISVVSASIVMRFLWRKYFCFRSEFRLAGSVNMQAI